MISQILSGQLSKQLIQDLDYSIPPNKGFVLALNSEIRLSKSNSVLFLFCSKLTDVFWDLYIT